MIQTKTTEEITTLKEGGVRLHAIIQKLLKACEPGIAVKDIEAKAIAAIAPEDEAAFFEYSPRGAPRPFPAHVCVSVNDTIVHGIPTENDHILKDGDVVTIDMGLTHGNLITDSARTKVVGSSDDKKDRLLSVCKAALDAGIEAAQPNTYVDDISAAIEAAVGGEFAIFENLVGHGVGHAVHEDPMVPNVKKAGQGVKLPAGTVIAIEPMIGTGTNQAVAGDDGYAYFTADGSLSCQFEDTVAITKDGPLILTRPD